MSSPRWFIGAAGVVDIVVGYVRRPARLLPEEAGKRARPILVLVGPATGGTDQHEDRGSWSLGKTHDKLAEIRTEKVPLAVLTAAGTDPVPDNSLGDEARQVYPALDQAVNALSRDQDRRNGLKFPHLELAVWLLNQNQSAITTSEARKRELTRLLGNATQTPADDDTKRVSALGQALTGVLGAAIIGGWWIFRPLWFSYTVRFRRPYRWFRRQPYLRGAATPRSFLSFAAEVTGRQGYRETDEAEKHARLLLVHAFLEDLRRAYRRRLLSRLRPARRPVYPVLLVRGAGSNAAGLLLHSISQVRYDVGVGDPLVVLATGDRSLFADGADVRSVTEARNVVDGWTANPPRIGRADQAYLVPLAWQDDVDSGTANREDKDVNDVVLPTIRRSAGAMRGVLTTIVVVALVAAGWTAVRWYEDRCDRWQLGGVTDVWVSESSDSCVGLAEPTFRGFADDPETRQALDAIHSQNAIAAKADRHLTVVYFADLSPEETRSSAATVEELRGIAVAQDANNVSGLPTRVLLANAGPAMRDAVEVAERVRDYADEDPSVGAVVGFSVSRAETEAALRIFEAAYLPMIGIATSADTLPDAAPNYYRQVNPQNSREAKVAAAYARQKIPRKKVRIFYSDDPDDAYSRNLAEDATTAFEAEGLDVVDVHGYTAGNTAQDIIGDFNDRCPADEILFYAGRGDATFSQFLNAVSCESRSAYVLAGDDVTRYVADGNTDDYPTPTVDYLSFASSAAWGDAGCPEVAPGAAKVAPETFYAGYRKLFDQPCTRDALDGHALLAHDSITLLRGALRWVKGPGNQRRNDVHNGLNERGEQRGTSGVINLKNNAQVSRGKMVVILRVDPERDGDEPTRVFLCGRLSSSNRPGPDTGCPAD
ncbi:ABC transporter substrate-binding protein [Cryptosporangium sp. NPDC048952]|uniref:ABC transporter substrate-binding protein n=1 Tax=Cryptosporangium sp. NPDC048952 TaxID=3363961 RepID=UPI00371056BB